MRECNFLLLYCGLPAVKVQVQVEVRVEVPVPVLVKKLRRGPNCKIWCSMERQKSNFTGAFLGRGARALACDRD